MPVEMNRKNRECPKCKNPTIFDVDGKSYFCGKCTSEFNMDMTEKIEPVIQKEVAEIIQESPETLVEIKVLEEESSVITEVDGDVMINPDVLVQEPTETL